MKAVAFVKSCFHDANSLPDEAVLVVEFCATEDPQGGQINLTVSLGLNEAQIHAAIRNGLSAFINEQRGSNVIGQSDVRVV